MVPANRPQNQTAEAAQCTELHVGDAFKVPQLPTNQIDIKFQHANLQLEPIPIFLKTSLQPM